MDGNRRWARQLGLASPSLGHRYGAEHIEDVLNWCERAGIKHVAVFVCSAENRQWRGDAEIAFLMQVIENVVADRLARPEATSRVHIAGRGLRRQGARRHGRHPRPVHRRRDTCTHRLIRGRTASVLRGLAIRARSIGPVPPDPADPTNCWPEATGALLTSRSGSAVNRCPPPSMHARPQVEHASRRESDLELHPPDSRTRALASGTAAGTGVHYHASGGASACSRAATSWQVSRLQTRMRSSGCERAPR
jgi:hypothetical protein